MGQRVGSDKIKDVDRTGIRNHASKAGRVEEKALARVKAGTEGENYN